MKRGAILILLVLSAITARAELIKFYAITSNDSSGYAQFVGESQLYMDVLYLGLGQISLTFTNAGPSASSVSRIYFDYIPELNLNLVAINDGSGVEYLANPANPKNLPAGKNQTEAFISDLAVASNNPKPHQGINPYESLELIVSYNTAYDFLDALQNEELRVGMHVISIGEYSESFINEAIPEPATAPLLILGTVALRWLRLKKSRAAKRGDSFVPFLQEDEVNELVWTEIEPGISRDDIPLTRYEAARRQVRV